MSGKQQDALVILKLYELRREETFRRARAWFATEFNPESAEDIVNVMRGGYEESAHYRMVTSYWDTAASLVNNGGIDEKMFLEANTEHMAVFAKLEPFLADVRAIFGVPHYLAQLEQMVIRVPDAKEYLAKLRGLLNRWAEVKRQKKHDDEQISF
ncbi:MAG TPA: hypothetical protein VNA19_02220 [Pyrinomonadaceae bacterium]|jgi:hypothetical protein|nr:hypothetical protein [Pyrinomonadaceae bacterium]